MPPKPKIHAKAMNDTLITKLKEMRDVEKAAKQPFKVRAYNIVIKQLEGYEPHIFNMKDVDDAKFTGIGDGIRKKLEEIFGTGTIKLVEDKRALMQAVRDLSTVHGIGATKANELVKKHGIMTVETLKDHKDLLNDVQLKGLKYHADIQKRIPRAEMDKHNAYLTKHINTDFEIAGSYRRGLPDSGDIDIIMRECDTSSVSCYEEAIRKLTASKYIVEVLAYGDHKFMGICKLPRHKTFRRIDIMIMDQKRYPFALLYFTGSQDHNIWMRYAALGQGYSLNEYGFSKPKSKKVIDMSDTIKTERDIYKFLKLTYIEPTAR